MKSLVFKINDLEFLKNKYPGIYSLLDQKLVNDDETHKIWHDCSEDEYQELRNRFSFEIANATDSSGKVNSDGLRLQTIWNQE